jgi:hypothetical protein
MKICVQKFYGRICIRKRAQIVMHDGVINGRAIGHECLERFKFDLGNSVSL